MSTAPFVQCRACKSEHREGIDSRLLAGESPRRVSAWLEETHGERIAFQSLHNHRNTHLRPVVADEVKRRVAESVPEPESPPQMTAAMGAVVSQRMHHLDMLAWVANQAQTVAESVNLNLENKPSMGAVTLYLGCLREVREVAGAIHDILEGDRPVEVNAHIDSLGDLLGLALSPQPQPPPADKPTDP
jgi:hypothetical protein